MPQYSPYEEYDPRTKIRKYMEEIWPSVYRTINDILFGIIHFIIDTLSGLWRR